MVVAVAVVRQRMASGFRRQEVYPAALAGARGLEQATTSTGILSGFPGGSGGNGICLSFGTRHSLTLAVAAAVVAVPVVVT